jgi:repressor LexA
MEKLSERQDDIYKYIASYPEMHGRAPSQREIAEYFGLSRSTVREHISCLIHKGYILNPNGVHRVIKAIV